MCKVKCLNYKGISITNTRIKCWFDKCVYISGLLKTISWLKIFNEFQQYFWAPCLTFSLPKDTSVHFCCKLAKLTANWVWGCCDWLQWAGLKTQATPCPRNALSLVHSSRIAFPWSTGWQKGILPSLPQQGRIFL